MKLQLRLVLASSPRPSSSRSPCFAQPPLAIRRNTVASFLGFLALKASPVYRRRRIYAYTCRTAVTLSSTESVRDTYVRYGGAPWLSKSGLPWKRQRTDGTAMKPDGRPLPPVRRPVPTTPILREPTEAETAGRIEPPRNVASSLCPSVELAWKRPDLREVFSKPDTLGQRPSHPRSLVNICASFRRRTLADEDDAKLEGCILEKRTQSRWYAVIQLSIHPSL